MTGARSPDVDDILIEAIERRRLVEVVTAPSLHGLDPDHPSVRAAHASTTAIGELTRSHADGVRSAMMADGVTAEIPIPPEQLQHANVEVHIDPGDVDRARRALEAGGYAPVRDLSPGAWAAARRWMTSSLFFSTDREAVQVTLRWGPPTRASWARRAIAPAGPQLGRVDLPRVAWPLYSALRVFDLGVRVVRRRPADRDLGPHLPTPTTLIEPLLDVGGVGPDDELLDVGCGDGRVVIGAAKAIGCRGLGVDIDQRLISTARRAAAQSGLDDLVRFRTGDFAELDLHGITVAFVFLPVSVLPAVLDRLDAVLPVGSTVLAHELDAVDGVRTPDRSTPVFTDAAITVAHRWTTGPQAGSSTPSRERISR